MAKTPAPSEPAETPAAWKRYLLIGGPIAVVLLVLLYIFLPQIQIRGYLNRLGGNNPVVVREMRDALQNHPDRDLVNRLLLEAVQDDDREFGVRLVCAELLVKRQRLDALEGVLRTGTVRTRGVILKTLSAQRYFKNTYVDDENDQYRAKDTVRAWLAIEGDLTRSHAIQLAILMGLKDTMPLIRPLLRPNYAPSVHPSVQRAMTIAAASAAERFQDCESVAALADLCVQAEDPIVRLRLIQSLARLAFPAAPGTGCAGSLEEQRMQSILGDALDHPDHRVRMGASLILARKPAWTAGLADRLQGLLDSDVTAAERRQALETLMVLADEAFLERFPRYFHDPAAEVRSSAIRTAAVGKAAPMTSCLIGLVEYETESSVVFMNALNGVREAIGKWLGFPEELVLKAAKDRAAFKRDLNTLFTRGEVAGLTRQALAETWFRWWCGELGLTEEDTVKAVAVRKAFWTAADQRDEAAARKALDGLDVEVVGLFTFERGWLMSRGG